MVDELVRISVNYYIISTSARIDDRIRVLKNGDTFAVFNRFGDIDELGANDLGIYHHDTRFLSQLVFVLEGKRPLLLSSTIKDDNAILAIDLMNPDISRSGKVVIPHGTVHFCRSKILWKSSCYERLQIHNFGLSPVSFSFSIKFDADFADIFEVRGMQRIKRGFRSEPQVLDSSLCFQYQGLDGRTRQTDITFNPSPSKLSAFEALYNVHLKPREEKNFQYRVSCQENDALHHPQYNEELENRTSLVQLYEEAVKKVSNKLKRSRMNEPKIFTSNEQFNDWVNRSLADLHMMQTDTQHG